MQRFIACAAAIGLLAVPVLPGQVASACPHNCHRHAAYQGSNDPGWNQAMNDRQNANQNRSQNQQNPNQTTNQNQGVNQNQTQPNQNTNTNQQQPNQQNTSQTVVQAPAIPVGSRITLPGDYGSQMGSVYLVIGAVKLPIVVETWDASGITLTLPDVLITSAQQMKLEVTRVDQSQVVSLDITLNPAPQVIVLDNPPVVVPAQTADVKPGEPAGNG